MMWKKKHKGLNYTFIRWKHGPFSQEVYSDVEDLKNTGFLCSSLASIPSEEGEQLARIAEHYLDGETREIFERVINKINAININTSLCK